MSLNLATQECSRCNNFDVDGVANLDDDIDADTDMAGVDIAVIR